MPSVFTADPEDLDSSRSDESEEWPDNDDVMTEIKKWAVFKNTYSYLVLNWTIEIQSAQNSQNYPYLRLQLEEIDSADEIVSVPPEEVVAEKQTLLSKLHSFEKKDEMIMNKQISPEADKTPDIVPPKPAPRKIEVGTVKGKNMYTQSF